MTLLHNAPAVGFDQPFELLQACHDRVHRTLGLLLRLSEHLQVVEPDQQARDAAADVMRYFDVAAPHHHQDEERHVFPRLRSAGLSEVADRLEADHQEMHLAWLDLRTGLEALHRLGESPDTGTWKSFVSTYQTHIALEERAAFPMLSPKLSTNELVAMGAEMAGRRAAPG